MAANSHAISTYYCHFAIKVEKVGVNWTRNPFELSLAGRTCARTRRSKSTCSARVSPSLVGFWVSFFYMTPNSHVISSYYCHFLEKVEKFRVNWTRNRENASFPSFFSWLDSSCAKNQRSTSTFSTRVTPSLVRFWVSFLDMTANSHVISSYYCHFLEKVGKSE